MSRNPMELFVEAFPAAAGQTLSGKTSLVWTITLDQELKPLPPAVELLTMILVAEPSHAEAAIQLSLENAHSLAALLGGGAPVSAELQHGDEQAVRAVLGEASEIAATVLEGIKVHLRVAKAVSWTPARQFSLTGTNAASGNIQLQLLFPANWPQAIASPGVTQEKALPTTKDVNVSLLENVEIAVTLQFGERRLPLREIGELRSGSVIELDKYVQDPADLLLGDRVVARGEVVIVEGNYGLRITEVV